MSWLQYPSAFVPAVPKIGAAFPCLPRGLPSMTFTLILSVSALSSGTGAIGLQSVAKGDRVARARLARLVQRAQREQQAQRDQRDFWDHKALPDPRDIPAPQVQQPQPGQPAPPVTLGQQVLGWMVQPDQLDPLATPAR